VRMHARLERLERLEPQPPESSLCPTCGEPRAWALQWQVGLLPQCLDCGGVILVAGSPTKRPPPPVSPLIQALTCERCFEPAVTAYYFGRAEQLCAPCVTGSPT